ncbi:MAG: TraR/DksA C4-type zinc finger protein [Rhodobacteraceae bacterium]|nr:TraR/DksA C4-type zinc finger protein [Paracoccaceae bacterium]
MNETDIARITDKIQARLREIKVQDQLGQDAQAVVELDQQAIGRLSRMDAMQHQAMARAQQSRRNTEILRLNAALVRMDEGEYGYCEDCGDAIAAKRLEFDPAASKCITCASL